MVARDGFGTFEHPNIRDGFMRAVFFLLNLV